MNQTEGRDLHERALDEVQVWTIEAGNDGPHDADLLILDDLERARAAAYRRDIDRDRYVKAHAFLRRVLAAYLDVPPERVAIQRSRAGKPSLAQPSDIGFSLSHADDLAAVAVVRGRDVGVDVERLRPIDDAIDLARTHFTDAEAETVRAASGGDRDATFLRLWTRKESVVKALGGGLSVALDTFDVLADHGSWSATGSRPSPDRSFSIASIVVPARYVGAVAVTGPPMPTRRMGGGSPR